MTSHQHTSRVSNTSFRGLGFGVAADMARLNAGLERAALNDLLGADYPLCVSDLSTPNPSNSCQ
jgi:hypothetical protein